MKLSQNLVLLRGNIGQDPEIRFTQSNVKVLTANLATTESYKDASDNWVEETTWHKIIKFNPSDADVNAVKKGAYIGVVGKITNRSYEDKDGITRYVSEVKVDTFVK